MTVTVHLLVYIYIETKWNNIYYFKFPNIYFYQYLYFCLNEYNKVNKSKYLFTFIYLYILNNFKEDLKYPVRQPWVYGAPVQS